METLQSKFENYVSGHSICSHDDKILLAVSGGVDSMVMLSLFAEAGYQIGVAHCNFQLRGPEAEEDEQLVADTAEKLGVPHYNIRFDTLKEMEQTGESVQMAARRLRYAWFDSLCDQYGYQRIAIAHHGDDSVETFLINLLRGTGLRGLTGISVINGRLIRPLLFSTRKEILDYALHNNIPFREDSSNSSTKYLRNKIRLGVVPRIKEISPQFTETMSSNVERLTAAQGFIDRSMAVLRQRVVTDEGDHHIIEVDRIDPMLPVQFVVYELLRGFHFNPDVINQLYHSFETGEQSTGKRFYSRDYAAYIDRRRIIVMPIPTDDVCELEANEQTHRICCGGNIIRFEHLEIDDLETLRQPDNVALLDEQKLHYPLHVRRWRDGDTFIPFGMSGHKKVSDLLIDSKVSLPDKQRQFVVLSGDEIVWVIGRRVDERYRVDSNTENVLRLTADIDPA